VARYYFNLPEGSDVLLDPEGCVLPDLAAAVERSLQTAREMLSADVLEGRLPLAMRLDIANEAGAVVHSLSFPDAVVITGQA
jgi:hypothetical protein